LLEFWEARAKGDLIQTQGNPMLETTMLEHIQQLPESLQQEVLHYMNFFWQITLKAAQFQSNGKLAFSKGLLPYRCRMTSTHPWKT
jgi:hypothetical protein